MDALLARRAIESLRKGIPPDGCVRTFTVGRRSEVGQLAATLSRGGPAALLLKADYGSGKTHLLRFLREMALEEGYAVSYIALDSKSSVRFNRMDQIFGAVIRNICMPVTGEAGPGALFGAVLDAPPLARPDGALKRLPEALFGLKSPALFLGLLAWIAGTRGPLEQRHMPGEVEAWLCEPWNYYTRRRWLQKRLDAAVRACFGLGLDGYCATFNLREHGCHRAWEALADLDLLARSAGSRGLVLLVDEFEDVIYNLKGGGRFRHGPNAGRVDYQFDAFCNLFRLFAGDFPGLSFYAVTPGFVNKCTELLKIKGYGDFDYSRFEVLPTFEMSALDEAQLRELAWRITQAHGLAYEWEPTRVLDIYRLYDIVRSAASVQVPDRARQTIRRVVGALDELQQNSDV